MEKKDIHRWNDSFVEAEKMYRRIGITKSLQVLNRIVENECANSQEQAYYIGMIYYVTNPNRINQMKIASKIKDKN
jgi:hypothetical protein